jgi:hypothetical protein
MHKMSTWSRFFVALLLCVVAAQAVAQKPFDWSEKWHGQRFAVGIISRGEALKGKHFDSKINRLAEHPWNPIQTLLGGYMINRLYEGSVDARDPARLERMAIATCASVMTMLSTHQQLYEGHVVYQLDDWRQGDKAWKAVWDAPQLAEAIWHLTEEQTRSIEEIAGLVRRKLTIPPYVRYEPGERADEYDLTFAHSMRADEVRALIDQAMPILTAPQQKEVRDILSSFEKRFEEASSRSSSGRG